MRVLGIDHINLSTRNLPRAIDFYTRRLGFEIREDGRDAERPWVILGADGRAYLALHHTERHLDPETRFSVSGGINHWGFHVDDLDGAFEELDAAGVKIRFRDAASGPIIQHAMSRSFYIEDPDGVEIEIAEVFGGGLG